jgi:hypothetical protein
MAAGLGFKTFTTGEVLTAADTNGYLMQGILVFASAAARDAAITSPQEGQACYLKDTDDVLTYSGSAWVDVAPSSSEKSMLLPQNAGRYIKPYTTTSVTTFTLVEDTTYYFPIYLSGIALDRISLRTGNSHTGTSTIRLGLYNANATTGKPDTVFLDAGTVACNATNTNFEITISSTPPAGFYYVAINAQTITGTPIVSAFNATNTLPFYFLKTTDTVESVTYLTGYSEGSITGAFATAGSLTVITSAPVLTPLRMA